MTEPRRFLLDASISYQVAAALRLVAVDVVHVSEIAELLTGEERSAGQCAAEDEHIAGWCGDEQRVLIAIDSDYTARDGRAIAFRNKGVEVIWFLKDPKGSEEHLRAIVRSLPGWRKVLGRCEREARVWIQHANRNEPELFEGKAKRRARRNR